ncbi:MAG: hypothetical protein IKI01_02545 [Lachnospiraceae bacterium]|nr:hypothetical protein [Lachnospiraceae bacterium]
MIMKHMRRLLCVVLCLVMLAALAGCEKKGGARGSSQNSVDDILRQGMDAEDKQKDVTPGENNGANPGGNNGDNNGTNPGGNNGDNNGTNPGGNNGTDNPDVTLPTAIPTEVPTGEPEGNIKDPDPSVDVDLTCLSSTMVYAEVSNIVLSPEKYIGKTMKMDGLFAVYHDEETDQYYYACLIQDATACCQNGIEFVPADARKYPDDFPELGTNITVTGVFDTYEEGGYTYCTLREAKLIG